MNKELMTIETELKKRLKYPYKWGNIQNNYYDKMTNFIYTNFHLDEVINRLKSNFENTPDFYQMFNYALNRWYNFWSAVAIEKIFCSFPSVTPSLNQKDRLVDFTIQGISFDHKTSIFPKYYQHSIEYAKNYPENLINWLYTNQSREQRQHFRNRLFIVVYNKGNVESWKLKAEIEWLEGLIRHYIEHFDEKNLKRLKFLLDMPTLSDIIWAEQ